MRCSDYMNCCDLAGADSDGTALWRGPGGRGHTWVRGDCLSSSQCPSGKHRGTKPKQHVKPLMRWLNSPWDQRRLTALHDLFTQLYRLVTSWIDLNSNSVGAREHNCRVEMVFLDASEPGGGSSLFCRVLEFLHWELKGKSLCEGWGLIARGMY